MNLVTALRPEHDEQETEGIATFETYAEASAAVDELAEREFPVERTTIVARNCGWSRTSRGGGPPRRSGATARSPG